MRFLCEAILLSVVVFDNEGLVDFLVEFGSFRKAYECAFSVFLVNFDECRCGDICFKSVGDACHVSGTLTDGDDISGLEFDGRDIDLLAVDLNVTVVDELSGAFACSCETKSVDDIVKSAFKQDQEVDTSHAFHLGSFSEQSGELTFVETVHVSDSLLFTELCAVVAELDSLCRAVLTRSISTLLKLFACFENGEGETSCLLPYRTCVTCHVLFPP